MRTPCIKLTDKILELNSKEVVQLAEALVAAQQDAKYKLHNMCRRNHLTENDKVEWLSLAAAVEDNVSALNDELVPVMALTPFLAKKLGTEQKQDALEEAKDAHLLHGIANKMRIRSERGLRRATVLESAVPIAHWSPAQEAIRMSNEEGLTRNMLAVAVAPTVGPEDFGMYVPMTILAEEEVEEDKEVVEARGAYELIR